MTSMQIRAPHTAKRQTNARTKCNNYSVIERSVETQLLAMSLHILVLMQIHSNIYELYRTTKQC